MAILEEILFTKVESDSFLSKVGVISTLGAFLALLNREESIRFIKDLAKSDPKEFVKEIIKRIKKLITLKVDRKKLHPYDHAIATYLFVVSQISNEDIPVACRIVMRSKLTNLWWTNFTISILKDLEKDVRTQKFDLPPIALFAGSFSARMEEKLPLIDEDENRRISYI